MPFPDNHHPHGVVSPPPPKPNPKLLSLVLKAIIMGFVTTLFFLFLGVAAILLALATAAFHLHNNRQSHRSSSIGRSPLPAGPPSGLSVRELKRVPQFRESRARGDAECVICLEGVRQGQWCRRLPRCGHVFHRRCLDSWLVKVPSCPVCRARVRSGNLVMEEDNREEMSPVVSGFDWRSDLSVLVN